MERLQHDGSAHGHGSAARQRALCEARARTLGYQTHEDYLRSTYVQQGAKMADIERALRASYPAIRGDLEHTGIPIRHHRERRQDRRRRWPS